MTMTVWSTPGRNIIRCGAAANTRQKPGSGLAAVSEGGMIDPVLFGRCL
jgi:hypothetical protein